ncbi:uncharacterized protein [Lepisosteus oculatus]|uniref:uncharacterized protein isoform X3 n=1 Tax=Lepisosteus oculatus TaxID=7918 RepID=UPI0035F51D33
MQENGAEDKEACPRCGRGEQSERVVLWEYPKHKGDLCDIWKVPTVQAELQRPNISISGPVGRVTWGQNFSISCSAVPQLTNSTFRLVLPDGTRTTSQPAVNHTAIFPRLAARLSDQGSYSCLYEVVGINRTFNESSSPFSVMIKAKMTASASQRQDDLDSCGTGPDYENQTAEYDSASYVNMECAVENDSDADYINTETFDPSRPGAGDSDSQPDYENFSQAGAGQGTSRM